MYVPALYRRHSREYWKRQSTCVAGSDVDPVLAGGGYRDHLQTRHAQRSSVQPDLVDDGNIGFGQPRNDLGVRTVVMACPVMRTARLCHDNVRADRPQSRCTMFRLLIRMPHAVRFKGAALSQVTCW